MKKNIYIFVALTAFACGVFVFYIRPLFIPISLSELRENISYYKFQKVKVRGNLEVVKAESSYFLALQDYKGDCSSVPCFKSLELSEEARKHNDLLIEELAEKNTTLGKTDFRSGVYLAEVEITGYLEERKNNSDFPFDSHRIIKVEEISQISPVRFVASEEMRNFK
jgi:hypothetical protein